MILRCSALCLWSLSVLALGLISQHLRAATPVENQAFTILFPRTDGFTRAPVQRVVVSVPPEQVGEVRLQLGEDVIEPETVAVDSAGTRTAHFRMSLNPGENRWSVELWHNERRLHAEEGRVVYWHELQTGRSAPEGMSQSLFHTSATEESCQSCHDMKAIDTLEPGVLYRTSCRGCHEDVLEAKHQHGPSQAKACAECHESRLADPRYTLPARVDSLCFKCHESNNVGAMVHGPTATGACTICHDPHATDHAYFLRKSAWDVCVTCHQEKASGVHVVAGFVFGNSHPTRGWPDPTQPGKDFSCASCHNPHATNTPFLWKYDAKSRGQLCVVCHPK